MKSIAQLVCRDSQTLLNAKIFTLKKFNDMDPIAIFTLLVWSNVSKLIWPTVSSHYQNDDDQFWSIQPKECTQILSFKSLKTTCLMRSQIIRNVEHHLTLFSASPSSFQKIVERIYFYNNRSYLLIIDVIFINLS